MSKSKNEVLKGLFAVSLAFGFVDSLNVSGKMNNPAFENGQKATVIGRHTSDFRHKNSTERDVVYMDLDMDGDMNTAEALLEIANDQATDPLFKKALPNGTTRTVAEWKKLGMFYKDYPAYNL